MFSTYCKVPTTQQGPPSWALHMSQHRLILGIQRDLGPSECRHFVLVHSCRPVPDQKGASRVLTALYGISNSVPCAAAHYVITLPTRQRQARGP
jgi:hypothetical protein